jgi:Leucine-rich repeat (LRR) protein
LADNQLTDVASLAEIKNLSTLDLTGNPVPKSKVEALRKALPMCQIDF